MTKESTTHDRRPVIDVLLSKSTAAVVRANDTIATHL